MSSLSFNNSSSSEKEEEEKREPEREEYNKYILEDGIHEKVRAQIDREFRTRVLDKVYTRTRQRIREKGGMISHDSAMRSVIVQDGRKILDEILNEAIDELGKSYPLLAENLRSKDEKTREDAARVLHMMIKRRKTQTDT